MIISYEFYFSLMKIKCVLLLNCFHKKKFPNHIKNYVYNKTKDLFLLIKHPTNSRKAII